MIASVLEIHAAPVFGVRDEGPLFAPVICVLRLLVCGKRRPIIDRPTLVDPQNEILSWHQAWVMMDDPWKYQLRVYLCSDVAEAAYLGDQKALAPLASILRQHSATLVSQFHAF